MNNISISEDSLQEPCPNKKNAEKKLSKSASLTFDTSKADAEQLEKEFQERTRKVPTPLQRELSASNPFPFDALGPILGSAAKRIHEIVKAPDSICGQSALAAAALVVQPFADIHIDGRVHPLSLFMLTVAESGDRKSAVDAVILKPIRNYEKMLSEQFKDEIRVYKNRKDVLKKQRSDILTKVAPEFLESELNKLNQEPQRPLDPNILIEEPTLEGLHKLLATGQPSSGLFSDEGGRMLSGHGMSKDNMLKTACGLSSLWDGKPVTRIRGGDENLLLYGRRLSCHLMMQEVVLNQILSNELLDGQGLIARCLIVYPPTNAGNRPYNRIDISNDPNIKNYYDKINSILDRKHPLSNNDIKNELAPRHLSLHPDAMDLWVQFHDEIDSCLKLDGVYHPIRRMANKAAEQALRIGGILALIEDIDAENVTLYVMERAIKLMRFYLYEALRISDSVTTDPLLALAEATLAWMRKQVSVAGQQKIFSVRDLCKNGGPRKIRNKKMAEKILAILEDHEVIERPDPHKKEWRLV